MNSRDTSHQGRPSECPDRILGIVVNWTTEVNACKHTYFQVYFSKQHYDTPLSHSSPAVRFTPSLNLKPLHFEVPGLTSDWLFTGREWLFQEVDACLRGGDPSTSRGVVIVGNMGFGKTAIIARLLALSCHGNRMWPTAAGNQTMPKRKTSYTPHNNLWKLLFTVLFIEDNIIKKCGFFSDLFK